MKALRIISSLLALCVTLPIWFYLLYQVLVRVNASELMWFLFWVYVPLQFFVAAILKLTEKVE